MSTLPPDQFGFDPREPEETTPTPQETEEQDVLRSWADRLDAAPGFQPDPPEPAEQPEPESEPESSRYGFEEQLPSRAWSEPAPGPGYGFASEDETGSFQPPAPEPAAPVESLAPELEEQEVLRSWSDRLDALRAGELAVEAAAEPAPAPESPRKTARTSVSSLRPTARQKPKARARSQNHRRLVGLKIGASQLVAATVTNNGSAELVQLAREPLLSGIVVGGEVREPVELGEALADFFKKHKLPKKDVRLGIAANRIGVRTFELPDVKDPRQLENAILFRAQEVLPIPVNESVLDYHILDAAWGEESPRVLLVVAYRELVDGFLEACELADITLAGIDLEAFALLRALGEPLPPEAQPRAARVVVAIGHHRSTVAVTNGRICEFTRVIDWGGDKLDVALARALGITPQEAGPLKHDLSLTGTASGEEEAAREAVLRELHAFTRDLVSSLHFYQSQPGALELADLALTGGTAHMPGLAQELQRLIGVDVRVADPFTRVRIGKKVETRDESVSVGSLTVAIGLGIED